MQSYLPSSQVSLNNDSMKCFSEHASSQPLRLQMFCITEGFLFAQMHGGVGMLHPIPKKNYNIKQQNV